MQTTILSICIPTYNRCKYLEKCIESIVTQRAFIDGQVEVIVSDNCSYDGTEALMNEYSKSYTNIRYYKNTENIRDRNFALAIERGTGIYRKLFNDTVIFLPHALDKMCNVISNNRNRHPAIFWANGFIRRPEKRTGCAMDDFVKLVGYHMTSIARLGLWEDESKDIRNDKTDCDIKLWQVHKMLDSIIENGDYVIDNTEYIITQEVTNKNVSYGLFKVFYSNFLGILNRYVHQNYISEDVVDSVRRGLLMEMFCSITVDLKTHSQIYVCDEDLEDELFEAYHKEPYWIMYRAKVRFLVLYQKLKKYI